MRNFSISNNQISQGSLSPVKPAADSASTAPVAELSSLAEFNELAGVGVGVKKNQATLKSRHLAQMQRTPQNNRLKKNASKGTASHTDALHTACAEAVEMLNESGQSSLEQDLASRYDAFEQHTILRGARNQIDDSELSDEEKEPLLADIDHLIGKLMLAHGAEIEAAEQVAQEMEAALDMLKSQDFREHSTRELRQMLGAKGKGRREEALTPLQLAKSMKEQFGSDNFTTSLQALRKKFSEEQREFKPRSQPEIWMSLSDAASFTTVQNGFSVAGELRRNISEQAGITVNADQAELTVALLELPASSNIEPTLDMLADKNKLNANQQEKLLRILRNSIASLPVTWWEQEQLPQRMQLLENLRKTMIDCAEDIVAVSTDAQVMLEEQLRRQLKDPNNMGSN